MADFNAAKVVAAVPSPPEPDTIYLVRTGAGFDMYVTNSVGEVKAYPLNVPEIPALATEAEAGQDGDTILSWTATRIRQAIKAWFEGLFPRWAREFLESSYSAEDARDALELAEVATSGSYDDLDDKPSIPAAQVPVDWNASTGVARILNKPVVIVHEFTEDTEEPGTVAPATVHWTIEEVD